MDIKVKYDISNLKNGILDCLKDIENNIDTICDRLSSRCSNASIEIVIKPTEFIYYIEKQEVLDKYSNNKK